MFDKNAWNRSDYQKRRAKCEEYLGGKCAECEEVKGLHFDHIDASTKLFSITGNINRKWADLKRELDKCQLLCEVHHKEKTKHNKEHAGGHNKWQEIKHGTLHAYTGYKCRCDECKSFKREYRKRY